MEYIFKVSGRTSFPQIVLAECLMWDLIREPTSNEVGNCDSAHRPQKLVPWERKGLEQPLMLEEPVLSATLQRVLR